MLLEPDLDQRLLGAAGALAGADAADRQRQLNVAEHALVRDEIVALEDEADRVVAVAVPVAVGVTLGGDAVDDQVAVVVAVETPDDIQQGGLAGAALSEDGDKFAVPQVQRYALKRLLYQRAGFIYFSDVFYLKHEFSFESVKGSCKGS